MVGEKMRYYKNIINGYIVSIGKGEGYTEITKDEYDAIVFVLNNKPKGTETTDYQLKENLTWEEYEIEPVEPEPTAEEIVNILTGESE